MKTRSRIDSHQEELGSRDEVRALAEALGLYRSAVTHLAERASARPRPALQRAVASLRLRLLLGPALGAAVAASLLVPLYSHLHQRHAAAVQAGIAAQAQAAATEASIDDTALMNQIDSQLSQSVPDALEPLAALSTQAATQNSVPEKKP